MYGNHYPNDDTFGQKYDNKNIVDGTAREAAAGNFSGQGSPEYSSYSSGQYTEEAVRLLSSSRGFLSSRRRPSPPAALSSEFSAFLFPFCYSS